MSDVEAYPILVGPIRYAPIGGKPRHVFSILSGGGSIELEYSTGIEARAARYEFAQAANTILVGKKKTFDAIVSITAALVTKAISGRQNDMSPRSSGTDAETD